MSNQDKDWIPHILSIAEEASIAINDVQQRKTYQIKSKSDNSPVTEADLLAHHIIEKGLAYLDPAIPVISEEGGSIPFEVRSRWPRFWLVDPLDGTREFIRGTGEFTVNIALIENHTPVLGVIAVPRLHQQYWATKGSKEAYRQDKGEEPCLIQIASVDHLIRIVASYRFDPLATESFLARLKNFGDCELTYCGSSLKICLVADGKRDLYPQIGKTSEWDTAAGHCILEAAGGQLINFKGEPLRYNERINQENPPFYALGDHKLVSICCG